MLQLQASAPAQTPSPDQTTIQSPHLGTGKPFNLNAFHSKRQKKRMAMITGALGMVVLVVGVLVAVSQIQVIREFFSQASGEPANIVVDTQAVLGPMPRPWRNLAQGGEAFDWRLEPLVPKVKALKPEYIRIDHIYDFYDIVKGTPGNLTFDFSKMDPVVDDILATGAKPYIALSYMPPAIASGDIVSAPKNWADWQLVVQKTIEHYSGTKGISDIYYEVWNEPDLFGGWKYYGDKSYLTLYTYSARGAANARNVKPFKLGGPGITALYKNWFHALAKHAVNNNLRLDFFSWHRYNLDIDQYKQDMTEARTWLADYPQLEPTLELHITEWGHDSNNHAGYDSGYGAAHTVAGAIEMVGIVQRAFAFEIQDGPDPAGQTNWGRWGMFTAVKAGATAKPRYYALQMLDSIGDQRLSLQGKGYWVKGLAARNAAGNTEVLLANYDRNAKHVETVPVTFTNILPGSYTVTKKFLSGQLTTEKVATTAAALQINVAMPVNSVAKIELKAEEVQQLTPEATQGVSVQPAETAPQTPIAPPPTTDSVSPGIGNFISN
jgi:xylan 1,4-beta-xylosidase